MNFIDCLKGKNKCYTHEIIQEDSTNPEELSGYAKENYKTETHSNADFNLKNKK